MTEKFNPINIWNKHRYMDAENDNLNNEHREQRSSSIDQTNNAQAQREPVQVLPSDFGANILHSEQDSNFKNDSEDMISRKKPTNFDLFNMKNAELPDYKAKSDLTHDKNINFFGDSNVGRRISRTTLDQESLHRGNISTLPSAGTVRRASIRQHGDEPSVEKQPTLMGRATAAVATVGAAAAAGLGISDELRDKSKQDITEMPSTWPDSPKTNKDCVEPAIHGQNACFETKDQVCDNITDSDKHSFCDRVQEPSLHGQNPSFYGQESVNNHKPSVNNNVDQQIVNKNNTTAANNNFGKGRRLSDSLGTLFGKSSPTKEKSDNLWNAGNRMTPVQDEKSNKKGLLAGAGLGAGISGLLSRKNQVTDYKTTAVQIIANDTTNDTWSRTDQKAANASIENQDINHGYEDDSGVTTAPQFLVTGGNDLDNQPITESMDELPKTWGDQSSSVNFDENRNLSNQAVADSQEIHTPSTHSQYYLDNPELQPPSTHARVVGNDEKSKSGVAIGETVNDNEEKSHTGAAAEILSSAGIGAALGSTLNRNKKEPEATSTAKVEMGAEQKTFGNNEQEAFGGGSTFGNTPTVAVVDNGVDRDVPATADSNVPAFASNDAPTTSSNNAPVAGNHNAPAAAKAPVINSALKINKNNSTYQNRDAADDLGITAASPISYDKPLSSASPVSNDKFINLNQSWTNNEIDQGSATKPRRWSTTQTTPEHHIEKRLAVGGIMGATANAEGVKGLNKLYPENSHWDCNEPIKSRLGEAEITDEPRRRSSVSETVTNLLGLNKDKNGVHKNGNNATTITEDTTNSTQLPLNSTDTTADHDKALLARGVQGKDIIDKRQDNESISSTRATTGQIVPDTRDNEVKDRMDTPQHKNFSTVPDSMDAKHQRKNSITQGFKKKAAVATDAFHNLVRRLSSHNSDGSIKKDSIQVRRMSDAEVFKNKTLGEQNTYSNNANDSTGINLPATSTVVEEPGQKATVGYKGASLAESNEATLSTDSTGAGAVATNYGNANAGEVPKTTTRDAITDVKGGGAGPTVTNLHNNVGVTDAGERLKASKHNDNTTTAGNDSKNTNHIAESPGEAMATNNFVDTGRRGSSTDSEHLKYTGVHKAYSRIPGVHTLRPADTAEVSNNDMNFIKQEEQPKITKSTLVTGHMENRRGSIQKTVGRLFGNDTMQDKGALKELSGQGKINAYNAAHNKL